MKLLEPVVLVNIICESSTILISQSVCRKGEIEAVRVREGSWLRRHEFARARVAAGKHSLVWVCIIFFFYKGVQDLLPLMCGAHPSPILCVQHMILTSTLSLCFFVHLCVRACMRARARARLCDRLRAYACARVCVWIFVSACCGVWG